MAELTVYEKPTCSKCRALAVLLEEREVAELRLGERDVPDDELIALMVEHPQLLQRPVVERGDRAVLARPPERVLEILD